MVRRTMLTLAAVALLVAACGDDTGTTTTTSLDPPAATAAPETTTSAADTTTTTAPPETTTTAPAETTTALPADADALHVGSADLGEILVDAEGYTLYLFTLDEGDTSACTGRCIETWPAVEAGLTASDGTDADLIGSITRDDGTSQATYGGHPLYYFAGDAAPGDTNGQGVNDVWFVISPAGDAIVQPLAPSGGAYDY